MLLTRTDGPRKETYLVPLGDARTILDCGDWHPVRFLPTAPGDVHPYPVNIGNPSAVMDAPIDKTLVRRRSSIEFSTVSGKKIIAEF